MNSLVIPAAVLAVIVLLVLGLGSQVSVTLPGDESGLPNLGQAPDLQGISGWINSEPFSLEDLRGKVVLVDFWTYSCINCIRTLPYLVSWHESYADDGLVIVGVHTPEFEFEKDYGNVKDAVDRHGIEYAVVQDNSYQTWRAYKNNYWPRKYIVDREGSIRYDHIGEGAYEETEAVIQALLGVSDREGGVEAEDVRYGSIGTPELYFGHSFLRTPLGNPEGVVPGEATDYGKQEFFLPNVIYLSGKWTSLPDHMLSGDAAGLDLVYTAGRVHMVLGGEGEVEVLLDGEPVAGNGGEDVSGGKAAVSGERLYRIVTTPEYGTHHLELKFSPGIRAYSFTFG